MAGREGQYDVKRKKYDMVTSIFSNTHRQTDIVVFRRVDKGYADIRKHKQKVKNTDYLLKSNKLSLGLHKIDQMKFYLRRSGKIELTGTTIMPNEIAGQLWCRDLFPWSNKLDIQYYAQKPWGRQTTVALFTEWMRKIIRMFMSGYSIKQVFKKEGKGIDYDTFIYLIKDNLVFKRH